MNTTEATLLELFSRIPRRHSADNVKEIQSIISSYRDCLTGIESENIFYEKNTPVFFNQLDTIRGIVKKSTDVKASKKNKDNFFDEASAALKDSMQELLVLYNNGSRKE